MQKSKPTKAEMNTTAQTKKFRETLKAEAAAYDVALTAEAIDGLSRYYELLSLWNSRVHLVAPCSPAEFATRHILESLILLKHLALDANVAEVGAGPRLVPARDFDRVFAKESSVFARSTNWNRHFPESECHQRTV